MKQCRESPRKAIVGRTSPEAARNDDPRCLGIVGETRRRLFLVRSSKVDVYLFAEHNQTRQLNSKTSCMSSPAQCYRSEAELNICMLGQETKMSESTAWVTTGCTVERKNRKCILSTVSRFK